MPPYALMWPRISHELSVLLIVIAFASLAVYWLLPRPRPLPRLMGGLAVAMAMLITAANILYSMYSGGLQSPGVEAFLFWAFSAIVLLSGGCLVTLKNPVYAALSFAMVVLSTCGLFLLRSAPFLMAATIIVYAGAIIVTFIFVIMLAQQHGPSDADARSREPLLATLTGFMLLVALVYSLQGPARLSKVEPFTPYRSVVSKYSQIRGATRDSASLPAANVAYLGRALFTDYLLAVELGGTLLLTATIGTILIVSRRPEARR